MRIQELSMTNVGPFDRATLRFLEGADDPRKVALITGENGTGKTVVIDAIRAAFGNQYAELERDLSRRGEDLRIEALFDLGRAEVHLPAKSTWGWEPHEEFLFLRDFFEKPDAYVVDYWRSTIATDPHVIEGLKPRDPRLSLEGMLQGTYSNANVAHELCTIDYLRDSRLPEERAAGEALWAVAERIVSNSLLDGGRLAEVERSTFTPMVEQAGHRVPLGNLSSGNAYLIGRMMTLLGRMYAILRLRGEDPAGARLLPGLLLIDEAENHLHPKWQKRLLPAILDVFPNLQIIATTHSPFVLASVPDARVFVCRWDASTGTCTVDEESGGYSQLPVEEILASGAFDGTPPFGTEISALLAARDRAIESGDAEARRSNEEKLRALNPTYFGFLDIEARVAEMKRVGR